MDDLLMFIQSLSGAVNDTVVSGGGGGGTPPPTYVPIGNIYNKSAWTDLSDFETSAGFSVSGGKIQVGSGAGYLRLPFPSMLDKYVFSVKYKLISGTETSGGLTIGTQSSNTTVAASGWAIGNLDATNRGMATLKDGYSNSTYNSSSVIVVNPGDQLQLDFSCDRGTYTVTWSNLTLGTTVSRQLISNFAFNGVGMGPNTGKMCILGGSAVYEVDSITHSSTCLQGGTWTFGDSITAGSNATGPQFRYSELLGVNGISAGGGDKTAELRSRMNEIINYIKPTRAVITIGTNDIIQGISSSIWQGNINSIVNQLQAASINVKLVNAPPAIGYNTSPIRDFELANYSSIFLNSWSTLSDGGTGLNPAYNSGDGVHFNKLANQIYADFLAPLLA